MTIKIIKYHNLYIRNNGLTKHAEESKDEYSKYKSHAYTYFSISFFFYDSCDVKIEWRMHVAGEQPNVLCPWGSPAHVGVQVDNEN
jgi:hypothetical protein